MSEGLFETATDREAIERAAAAAAPVAVERADLAAVHTLDAPMREPMFRLLSSLADNKYVLGRRYAEWCTGAPMLESAVAAAAMAQDELGHARSFYPLLRGFLQLQLQLQLQPSGNEVPPMEEKGWQQRPTSAMRCLDARFASWTEFVAANLVVDTALTVLLAAATESPYEPLRQRARKIQQEEAGHWVHATGWLRRLGVSAAESVAAVWDDAFIWYGQPDDPVLECLSRGGLLSEAPEQLRASLRARLEPVLYDAQLAHLLARPLPWERWDAAARRLR